MGLLLNYSLRNLTVRKLTTTLTVLGVGLVVFVFAAVLMLSHGLEQTLVDTGSPDNAIVVRSGATSETLSLVLRDQAGVVETQQEVAIAEDGTPVAVAEIVVLININKRANDDPSNVTIRGTTPTAFALRPGIRITEGRMFSPGTSEVIAGLSVSENFKGCGLGESARFAGREWTVVGVFDAGGTGWDSELWGDVEQVQQAFRRNIYSSMTVKLADPAQFEQMKTRLEADPRMSVTVQREVDFYRRQSVATSSFIKIMGLVISIVFSIGAMIGAMITMYAAVANRTVEIGTLRALGFSRARVLSVFLTEAMWLSLIGGGVGLVAASFMSFVTISTTNWDTFSELAFGFALSPTIIISSLIFAVVMGIAGGFLPAVRAARAKVVDSLRME
ncbi:MAG TPA: ABC transporter permease [candidate division Zixibacteria bacterium]|jgi:ABC-type antimicrobial peptide transport system permease subunit